MFNAEQREHMESLGAMSPEQKCWCGWNRVGDCHNPGPCQEGKTAADKMAVWCHDCHNEPGEFHRFSCPHDDGLSAVDPLKKRVGQ